MRVRIMYKYRLLKTATCGPPPLPFGGRKEVMKMKRHCCFLSCDKEAEFMIAYGTAPDDYTDSCKEHVGEMVDGIVYSAIVSPIEKEE